MASAGLVRELRRQLTQAPELLANAFAAGVRGVPPEQLERLMRTPLGRLVVAGIFSQMPARFEPDRARGTSATVRWIITRRGGGGDTYDVVIDNGSCKVRRGGGSDQPRVTITLDAAEFLRIATGISEPTKAYFSGRVGLQGDVMLAAKLSMLFRKPALG